MKRTILIMTFIFAMGFQDSFAMHNHFTFTHMIKNSILQTYKPDILLPTNYKSLDGFLYQNQDIKTVLKQFLAFKKKNYPYKQWMVSAQTEQILDNHTYLSATKLKEILGVKYNAFDEIKVYNLYKEIEGHGIDANTSLPIIEWIEIFSDEPDWGMDDGLFGSNDPRYGEIPFGTTGKTSSRAPFHTYYSNENFITYVGKSTLKESMAHLRFILFYNLAKFSFAKGEYFWGARFLGNATHYIQDITTPYHSSAVPYATAASYIEYFMSKNKSELIRQKTQLTTNKHSLYEKLADVLVQAFIHNNFPLNQFLDESKSCCTTEVIRKNVRTLDTDPLSFFKDISKRAYKSSLEVDKKIDNAFPKEVITNPDYDVEKDQNFSMYNYYNQRFLTSYLNGNEADTSKTKLLHHIRTDLNNTIEVTSSMICSIFSK